MKRGTERGLINLTYYLWWPSTLCTWWLQVHVSGKHIGGPMQSNIMRECSIKIMVLQHNQRPHILTYFLWRIKQTAGVTSVVYLLHTLQPVYFVWDQEVSVHWGGRENSFCVQDHPHEELDLASLQWDGRVLLISARARHCWFDEDSGCWFEEEAHAAFPDCICGCHSRLIMRAVQHCYYSKEQKQIGHSFISYSL